MAEVGPVTLETVVSALVKEEPGPVEEWPCVLAGGVWDSAPAVAVLGLRPVAMPALWRVCPGLVVAEASFLEKSFWLDEEGAILEALATGAVLDFRAALPGLVRDPSVAGPREVGADSVACATLRVVGVAGEETSAGVFRPVGRVDPFVPVDFRTAVVSVRAADVPEDAASLADGELSWPMLGVPLFPVPG